MTKEPIQSPANLSPTDYEKEIEMLYNPQPLRSINNDNNSLDQSVSGHETSQNQKQYRETPNNGVTVSMVPEDPLEWSSNPVSDTT